MDELLTDTVQVAAPGIGFGSADWVVLYKDEPPIILTVVGEREAQNAVDRLNEAFNRGYWEGRKRGPAT